MKNLTVLFTPQALTDIEEAVDYYNLQVYGLGNKFLSDFESAYKAIIRNPLFASVKYDDVRCAALKKFPFSVHYTINKKDKKLIILAVFNTWKKPFW